MVEDLKKLELDALAAIESAAAKEELEAIRIKYLGRSGVLAELMGKLPSIPIENRPAAGKLANEIKNKLTSKLSEKLSSLGDSPEEKAGLDVTLPGITPNLGELHPITKTIEAINKIFLGLGFRIVEGPEIEKEYYNFDALNIPKDHPSRESFHTFYLDKDTILRSQTSTVQIRVMEKEKPPLMIIAPGKVFRPDAVDASHLFMFNQVEGFMVDKDIKFSDLKGILTIFCKQMFGKDISMRFRPHFFPFTEPSAEIDISCIICKGSGCSVCGQKGWLEILGAGMINPKVFEAVGYDTKIWRGFAFGMGVERIAMLKLGIDDIRLFYENDLRFLKQF